MNHYVIPFDLLDINKLNLDTNFVELSMYCEIGGKGIDPDSPPTFNLIIKRQDNDFDLTINNDDFSPNEKKEYEKCIEEFTNKMMNEINLPPTLELVGLDNFDINPL